MKTPIRVFAILLISVSCSFALFARSTDQPRSRRTTTPPRSTTTTTTEESEQQPGTEPEATPRSQRLEREQQQPARERESEQESGAAGATSMTNFHFDMHETPARVTHHSIAAGGRTLTYTATAGRMPINNAEGKTEALMFYVAYTLDGANASNRPLTFAYNGGPGSATIWLHMGALGPRVVSLDPQGFMPQPPFRLKDNPYTPLDRTDLVLIDAIGTGYSRPADNAAAKKYENPEGDIQAFGEFIRMYISRNNRWGSPLYLFGESYGTTRSAGVAGYLQGRGIVFNGIGLLSMALNFQTLAFSPANDAAYPWNVPTYMAIAYYHHKLSADLQRAMDACQADPDAPCQPIQQAENWALTEYAPALARGDALSAQQRQAIVDRLAMYTGLRKDVIEENNLRVDVGTFDHNLLLDQRLRVGRLDGRYALPEPGFPGGRPQPGGGSDPASTATTGPFTMVFHNYVRTELDYKTDMPYYTSGRDSGFWRWSTTGATPAPGGNQGFQEEITPLRAAIVADPYLKVLVMEGFYDLATPYLQAEYTIHELNLPPQFQKNISYARYWSGHMVYLEQKSHAKLQRDWDGFIDATSNAK